MTKFSDLKKIQQLVLDVQKVERGHTIPPKGRPENVIERSFSVTMLCWRIFEDIKPNLDLEKILKYCLSHDFLERGLKRDFNTYATDTEKSVKLKREELELTKLRNEFSDFELMLDIIEAYENKNDEESHFVWCVDKMQGLILGDIDNWWPYERDSRTYKEFYDKGEEFLSKCPDCLKPTMSMVIEHTRTTYYDQPK